MSLKLTRKESRSPKISVDYDEKLFRIRVKEIFEKYGNEIDRAFGEIRQIKKDMVTKSLVGYVVSAILIFILILNFIRGMK